MKIIGITSCANGIAHSYMAAEALENGFKKYTNEKVKVEIQGALGIENRLSASDIADADLIVFANDVGIREKERFDGLEVKIFNTKPHETLKNIQGTVESAIAFISK